MMQQLQRIRAIFVLAVRRLLAQPLLTAATTIGLTIAVALIMTIPIYAESVAFRILSERLVEEAGETNRPPFSYLISFLGAFNDPIDWDTTEDLNSYLREQAGTDLGMTVTQIVTHYETRGMRLYTASETVYDEDNVLDFVSFGTTEGIFEQVELVEGNYPNPAIAAPDSIVEVMIHENFANEYGIHAGEDFLAFNWRLTSEDVLQTTPIHVAGIWRPLDENSSFWFYRPNVFEDILLVPQETFINRINPYSDDELNLAIWYLVTDGRGINTSRVDELITRETETEITIDQLLPGTTIWSSPADELRPYQRIVRVLTLTLTVFSIPIVALLIVFLMMIVGLIVDRQRNETAVLRSRGTSPMQVIGLAAVEGIIIGGIALVIGLGLATVFTQLIGSTTSFLIFDYQRDFFVSFPPTIGWVALFALTFTIIIRLVPTIGASKHTIISYKLATSRLLQRPLWQRLGLDILLLVIISYFYYQVVQQGALISVEGGASNIDDAYNQPFVFLLPPLTIFAFTLFILRLLPFILKILSWLIQLTNSVGLLIVTRQLERSPGTYNLPLILLVSTISLGIYTASFARTIDRHLYEQQYYHNTADIEVRVFNNTGGFGNDQADATIFIPVFEYNALEGISAATRFGEYSASAEVTSGITSGTFIGIDRAELGQVLFWRPDFATQRLGDLMNALASQPDTVLVSADYMAQRSLTIGDFVQIDVRSGGETVVINPQIVGVIDYFPSWYPEDDGALFVGNLDYLFEQAQGELPHRIIARINDNFDEVEFRRSLFRLGATGIFIDEPFTRIEREQARPERQGLFGLLSIGFVASSLATMIGFLLYSIFSYQKRYVELGILRAMGLSQGSMMVAIAWELGLLILMGLSIGVSIGLAVSAMYIPYMQFVSDLSGVVPPYLVVIAWSEIAQIMALFFLTFLVIMLILLVILRRMRIFEAVKLGETL